MKLNESQVTQLAYNLLDKKPADLDAVRTILELAVEQHPSSSMVYSRRGDYYLKSGDRTKAVESYQKASALDPDDQQTKEILLKLTQ